MDFLSDSDIMNLPLKTNRVETKGLILLFSQSGVL